MKKRSFLFLTGALCLLAVGSLLCAKVYYERKMRLDIEQFFATLPAAVTATPGSIEVSLLDRSATIRDIKGSCNLGDAGPMTFTVASLKATDFNLGAFAQGAGVTTLAQSIALTNITTSSSLVTTTIASYQLENIRGDFALLQERLLNAMPVFAAVTSSPEKGVPQQELIDVTIGVLQAYETVTIGKAALRGYAYSISQPSMEFVVEEMESLDSSVRKMGPSFLKNMQVKNDGKPFFSLDILRIESMVMPDFVPVLRVSNQNVSVPTLLSAFKGQPFAVRAMLSKNLQVRSLSNADSVIFSLADLTFDYTTEPNHAAKLTFSGMEIDKNTLRDDATIPPKAFALLPDVLSVEGALDLDVTAEKNSSLAIACKTFRLKADDLGSLAFSTDIIGLTPISFFMGSPGNAALRAFSSSLTDKGFSNFYFTVVGEEEEKSAADARNAAVSELAATRASLPNETLQNLMDTFIQFVKTPGTTFTMAITPEQPALLNTLQQNLFSSPGTLGVTSSVTPE